MHSELVPLIQQFESVADEYPDSIALSFDNIQICYGELNRLANRLSHRLIEAGVTGGSIVGIHTERSPEMIVSILATLKSGAAYLPLDPAYPQQRISFMLTDSGAVAVLFQSHLREHIQDFRGAAIELRADDLNSGDTPQTNPNSSISLGQPAYVIYTSGSTGKPKGVVVTHGNISRLFKVTRDWFQFGRADTWAMFHSYSFDVSVFEFWAALAHGGKLVVVPFAVSRTPNSFLRLLSDQGVTGLCQTPSAFRQLIDAESTATEPVDLQLQWIVLAGEPVEMQSLRLWFDRHGDQKPAIVNMYGPTETTVYATFRRLTIDDLSKTWKGSPIGTALPDLQIHILNDALEPVSDGAIGEMYISGDGVAIGYLNRPDLNAERFLSDPFAGSPNARMYRSGDLARRTQDGEIEFLGRKDSQVKIRGFRIELGEIESVIAAQPNVSESAVMVRGEQSTDLRIVAYVAARKGMQVHPMELKATLRNFLPDYMVPSAIVVLDSLPLTANGKLDRDALPANETAPISNLMNDQPVGSNVESQIGDLWRQFLHCPASLDDNFFDLGGNSIHLAKIHVELQKTFGEFPITDLFEHTTIRSIANHLTKKPTLDPSRSSGLSRARAQKQALMRRGGRS